MKELAEGEEEHHAHRAISEHVPPIRLADSVTFTPFSCSTQPPAAADVTRRDDNNIHIAPRRDAPPLNISRRFNKGAALGAASNEQEKRLALEALENDIFAASSKPILSSYERLWHELHEAWHGETVPVLPLTPEKVRAVTAMFKRGVHGAGSIILP